MLAGTVYTKGDASRYRNW